MLTMPLYGLLYFGYAYIGSLWGLKSGDINKCKDDLVKDKCKLDSCIGDTLLWFG